MAHKKCVIRLRSINKTSKQKQSMLCVILKYILMISAIFLNVCKLLRLLTNALDKLNRAIVPKHWSCIFFSIQPSIFYLQICIPPPPHTHIWPLRGSYQSFVFHLLIYFSFFISVSHRMTSHLKKSDPLADNNAWYLPLLFPGEQMIYRSTINQLT